MFGFRKSKKKKDPTPPVITSGKELYDKIMSTIEPDLTSENIKKLDAQYASETRKEKKARMQRYKKAFMRYLDAYEAYQAKQTSDIRSYGRGLVENVEKRSAHDEERTMNDLESAIATA